MIALQGEFRTSEIRRVNGTRSAKLAAADGR